MLLGIINLRLQQFKILLDQTVILLFVFLKFFLKYFFITEKLQIEFASDIVANWVCE